MIPQNNPLIRTGVHLEWIAVNVWRLIGTKAMYLMRIERAGIELYEREIVIRWAVKEKQDDKLFSEFDTAGSALAYAYEKAVAILL